MEEPHTQAGAPLSERLAGLGRHYARDMVYAANDGIVTTFAVVAGVRGAGFETFIVLALGFANLAADGLSMAIGDYHGIKTEQAHIMQERFEGWRETRHAAKHGLATWAAFSLAGLVPLLPFMLGALPSQAFPLSALLAGAALFCVGVMRTWGTPQPGWRDGLEMLLVGAVASGAAFGAGWLVARLTGA